MCARAPKTFISSVYVFDASGQPHTLPVDGRTGVSSRVTNIYYKNTNMKFGKKMRAWVILERGGDTRIGTRA